MKAVFGNSTRQVFYAAAALCFCLSLYTQWKAFGVADVGVTLINARQLLDGKLLYRDVFTVQPPLITWLYVAPVWLARQLGISDWTTAMLTGVLFAAVTIAACDRILARHPCFERASARRLHALLLAALFIADINPAAFFDRDHIFLMLALPYLLRCMPSLSGRPMPLGLSVLTGCLAALAFFIKPHCLIVFGVVQLLSLAWLRRPAMLLCTENLVVYALGLLYVALTLVVTPDYFRIVLPMTLQTYFAASSRANGILYVAIALVFLGIAFADYSWRAATPYRWDIRYLLVICVAMLLYALANNGWGYTYNPLLCYCLLVTGWMGMEYGWLKDEAEANGLSPRKHLFGLRACVLSLACVVGYTVVSGFLTVTTHCTQHLKCHRWGRDLIAAMDGAHSFGSISGDFEVWTRLTDATGAAWDTRFNHLWMMPKFFTSDEAFARSHRWILAYVADGLAEDMNRWKPDIMFVDDMDVFYLTPGHFDPLAYFSEFPAFRAAWSHYRQTGKVNTCSHPEAHRCGFDVYRRLP